MKTTNNTHSSVKYQTKQRLSNDLSTVAASLCCERGMATVRFNKYENHGISTVLVLSGLTIFGIIVAMIYVYDMDDFNAVAFTFIILPPGAVTEYNKLAVVNIVISFLCPTILLVSSRINKKRGLIGSTTLTSRYQTRENVITTEFAARIAILQVSFCVFQGVGGVVVRVLGNYLLHDNDVLYTSIRQMFYMLPIFTFVLPIYSLCQLKYYRSNREENIRSMVIMESRGVVGSRNYEEKWLDLVEYPLYRTVQVLYTVLSLASLPIFFYVLIKYIIGPTFHRNIKLILLIYYSLASFHAIIYSVIQIYALTSSLMNKDCSSFPTTLIYASLHLCIFATNFGLVLCLVALCCERSVATAYFSKYESNGIALALLLLFSTFVGVGLAMFYVYEIDDFKVKVLSFVILPPGAVNEYNQIAIANIIICFLCISILHISSRINRKRCTVSSATLSSRYQTRENVITTQFAAHIASLQVVFFILHEIGGLLSRIFDGKLLFVNEKVNAAILHMLYVIPIFTFVLPIYSVHRLKHYKKHRDDNIRLLVTMESRGVTGTQNYQEVITKSCFRDVITMKGRPLMNPVICSFNISTEEDPTHDTILNSWRRTLEHRFSS
ncbi:integral membrane protein Srb [Dictyocaulus viviparus]|uniref:Integral membrane protein Srb n=1 Tax=Dictyocaulus viviparus TaxID=29172 RepID=A0A0D8XAS0_DICVI|nr:integral membrane protein Srb [Dictyocaulus viviparus]